MASAGLTGCDCAALADVHAEDSSSSAWEKRSYVGLRKRGLPQWWLSATRCEICDQHWLLAAEERLRDLTWMRRLSAEEFQDLSGQDRWPADFDTYETLLRLGEAIEPVEPRYEDAPDLWPIAIDLIGQRPSLRDDELEELLGLRWPGAAQRLGAQARRAIAARGYPYPWQGAGNDEYEPRHLP